MGVCKDSMKSTSQATKSIFERWKKKDDGKKEDKKNGETTATSFADHIAFASARLEKLIESKSKDVVNDGDHKEEHRNKLRVLYAIYSHLDIISGLMDEYK